MNNYMMATKATHKLGDLSKTIPSLCYIEREDKNNYYGNWIEGLNFNDVQFPKNTTRELTEDEMLQVNGKYIGIGELTFSNSNCLYKVDLTTYHKDLIEC